MSPVKRTLAVLAIVLGLLLVVAAGLIGNELMSSNLLTTHLIADKAIDTRSTAKNGTMNQVSIERGAYLAKVGNCAACHTARGGEAFAGGKAITTPFGAVYTSNITPDAATGIGQWSADAFYRAMHEGRSANGKLLTPAFPFPNYTHVTRVDSDDLYTYFKHGVKPVSQVNKTHDLPFPFNTQVALALWRTLFFTPNDIAAQAMNTPASDVSSDKKIGINSGINIGKNIGNSGAEKTDQLDIQRGAYLVRGLGHCSACHAERNALGATVQNQFNDQFLSGALMPMRDWYAPSLVDKAEAGVAHLPKEDVVSLLKTGIAPNASMLGPMAEVVADSTQFWTDADLSATVAYLQSLPQIDAKSSKKSTTSTLASGNPVQIKAQPALFNRGAELFTQHCATCHGEQGQGMRVEGNVALPALAGNRAITMPNTTNLVRIILAGGYAPSTTGNKRPFGMPPFVHVLNDNDMAAVTTYIRYAWGNHADSVTAAEVVRLRRGLE
jgi:mono/diheme cytochrome c family protein